MSAIRVTDSLSNSVGHIIEAAKAIGRSKRKRKVFDAVYHHKKRVKTVAEIADATGLTRLQVLQSGVELYRAGIIEQTRKSDDTAYGQIPFFQHNKSKIIRMVEKPTLIKELAENGSDQIVAQAAPRRPNGKVTRATRKYRQKLRVLYLTATPDSQENLRTDAEFRAVQNEVRGSKFRDDIGLFMSPAADIKSILDGINDHRPQIVHFSGHGGGGGIWLDDGKVQNSVGQSADFALLASTLSATSTPPTLLVLNACDTLGDAQKLLSAVRAVVAMSDSISDDGAVTFAAQFYSAIASGQPVFVALEQGKIAMKAAMLRDAHLPEIICRDGVDPKKLRLVG